MKKNKKQNDDVYNKLVSLVVDTVETEFYVTWQHDDAGNYWNVYVPENHLVENLRQKIPATLENKRVILTIVPTGYIETFFKDKGA